VAGAPKKDKADGPEESAEEESLGPEREHFLMAFELAGGGRIALARGTQKEGRSILTVVVRR
jgi:hypothetical protein